jgi:protein-S-isoprenylcysteine O-methyltransferase
VGLNLLATVLLLAFFAPEFFLRKAGDAKSSRPGAADRGSSLLLLAAYGIALLATAVVGNFEIGQVALPIRWAAVAAMTAGLGIRVWSMAVLGKFYTRTLLTTSDQSIVERGPYRWLRHPGYLGSLLVWVGGGFAQGNWLLAALIATLMLAAYGFRIASEEKLLRERFGSAYDAYARRTWRLVPFVF